MQLVRVIEPVQHHLNLTESWFGMILIPFVSFSGDAVVASIYFLRYTFRIFFRNKPEPPAELAKGRSIDMAIQ
jgi:Ca2+:H+ antiporter